MKTIPLKRRGLALCLVLFTPLFSLSQGSSCATAIAITMDGVCRDYTISGSTGDNEICTSSGITPITYFSVTANSTAQCMILDVTGPDNQPVEVAMYTASNCNNGSFEPESSICFYDGTGLWAPAETFTITANKKYILRIKTNTTGTIRICGRYYTPPNDDCWGATPMGPLLINDNNACHQPGPGVTPASVCAPALQNTAFYYYTVDSTGESYVSLENTACDNNYGSNGSDVGYQFGLYTGNCSFLNSLTCYVGIAANVQVYTGVLAAGTKVYMAINGIQGSNCTYSVRAMNAMMLSATLKYFNAWIAPEGNILKWISLRELNNQAFEVQRSVDGANFTTIGTIAGQVNSTIEKKYQFNDWTAPDRCFYRLKEVNTNGKFSYSNIIEVNRSGLPRVKIKFNNPVSRMLNMTISTSLNSTAEIFIRNMNDQVVFHDKINCNKGSNTYIRDFSFLPTGRYVITASTNEWKEVQNFLKINSP